MVDDESTDGTGGRRPTAGATVSSRPAAARRLARQAVGLPPGAGGGHAASCCCSSMPTPGSRPTGSPASSARTTRGRRRPPVRAALPPRRAGLRAAVGGVQRRSGDGQRAWPRRPRGDPTGRVRPVPGDRRRRRWRPPGASTRCAARWSRTPRSRAPTAPRAARCGASAEARRCLPHVPGRDRVPRRGMDQEPGRRSRRRRPVPTLGAALWVTAAASATVAAAARDPGSVDGGGLRLACLAVSCGGCSAGSGSFHWWTAVVFPVPLLAFVGLFARSLLPSAAPGVPWRWRGTSRRGAAMSAAPAGRAPPGEPCWPTSAAWRRGPRRRRLRRASAPASRGCDRTVAAPPLGAFERCGRAYERLRHPAVEGPAPRGGGPVRRRRQQAALPAVDGGLDRFVDRDPAGGATATGGPRVPLRCSRCGTRRRRRPDDRLRRGGQRAVHRRAALQPAARASSTRVTPLTVGGHAAVQQIGPAAASGPPSATSGRSMP